MILFGVNIECILSHDFFRSTVPYCHRVRLEVEGSLVPDPLEALCCVLAQDTILCLVLVQSYSFLYLHS